MLVSNPIRNPASEKAPKRVPFFACLAPTKAYSLTNAYRRTFPISNSKTIL
jgi:hypothetical protein